MYTDRVLWPASDSCDGAQRDQAPSELFQSPQRSATCSGRAKRCRTKPSKWRGTERNNHTLGAGGDCIDNEKALDMELMRQEADLQNQLQVSQTLRSVEQAAHRDLLFVQDRIAKYQAGYMQLEAQNQSLQEAIFELTLTLHGRHSPNVANAPIGGHMETEGADADECSEDSNSDLVHVPFSKAS